MCYRDTFNLETTKTEVKRFLKDLLVLKEAETEFLQSFETPWHCGRCAKVNEYLLIFKLKKIQLRLI